MLARYVACALSASKGISANDDGAFTPVPPENALSRAGRLGIAELNHGVDHLLRRAAAPVFATAAAQAAVMVRPICEEAVAIDRGEKLGGRAARERGQRQYENQAYQRGTHRRHLGALAA